MKRLLLTTALIAFAGIANANQQGWTEFTNGINCLLYTSPSPRDRQKSRMPSSA